MGPSPTLAAYAHLRCAYAARASFRANSHFRSLFLRKFTHNKGRGPLLGPFTPFSQRTRTLVLRPVCAYAARTGGSNKIRTHCDVYFPRREIRELGSERETGGYSTGRSDWHGSRVCPQTDEVKTGGSGGVPPRIKRKSRREGRGRTRREGRTKEGAEDRPRPRTDVVDALF